MAQTTWAKDDCEGKMADFVGPMRTLELVDRANQARDQIARAIAARPELQSSYFKDIQRAVDSAMGKHQKLFAKTGRQTFNVARHRGILLAIAGFDPLEAKFSLYKIKRAIEAVYSLKEYTDCRED